MSKFSPIEFFESVKYYQGDRSPIDACKEENGYSAGWQHHKGRNPHHYEYWMDNFDEGGESLIIPKNYALELLKLGKTYCEVAREFKVSDNAIRKWVKSLGLNPSHYGRDGKKNKERVCSSAV